MDTQAQRRTAGLVEAGLALASELDIDALLQRIADLAREVVGARYAAVGVVGEDGLLLRFVYSGIDRQTADLIGDLPHGRGLLGVLLEGGRPIRQREISEHPDSYGFPPNHPPMHSFLGVPIIVRDRVFGRLYLTEKQGASEFTKDDERIAMTLAAQAGVAIQNANLLEEVKARGDELAVLEERDRISKELHDGVIQALFAVGIGLQGTAAMTEDNEIVRRLEHATEEVDRAIRDLRNYIFGLRPGILADRQLDQALRQLAIEFQERTGVLTIARIDEQVAAELAGRSADLVQLVREALSNVGRHAGATSCSVTLRRSQRGAELEIDDDGRGFDPSGASSGMGIHNLRDRAASLGGVLEIDSVDGQGTTIVARIPL